MTTLSGRLVLPTGVNPGTLEIENGRIARIVLGQRPVTDYSFQDHLIVPGFIDTHIHGLGHHGIFEIDDLLAISRMQVRYGTTGFLPTAASLPIGRFRAFGQNVLTASQANRDTPSSRILGSHFEGPFINPAAKGGMDPEYLRPVDLDECRSYLEITDGSMKIMTVAPELPGSSELIRLLRRHNVVVSIGHSRANREQLDTAVEAGLTMVCHLFNAFEREGDDKDWPWRRGLLDAILENPYLCPEVNCDMIHVRPEHVRLAIERFGPDRFLAITDSVTGAGFEPGEYQLTDGRVFSTREGVARLVSNGTMVGSIATMDRVFKNLVQQCGVSFEDAARFTSTNAARVLGFGETLGSIEVGKQADLTVLDTDFIPVATFVAGQKAYEK